MFKYENLKEQVIRERKKNKLVAQELLKKSADIDYIAMMCDIDLDGESEETDE